MTRRMYAGGAAATNTVGDISSSGGGTVSLVDATGWPDGSVGKFHIVIDAGTSAEEKILVDFKTGSQLTFSPGGRGADGTVSTSHSSGAPIWLCVTAVDLDEANAHLNSALNAHLASAIYFSPAGTLNATNVQAALTELDAESDARLDNLEASTALILTPGWVTEPRILDDAVSARTIATDAVTADAIAAGAVGTLELGAGITTWTPTVAQGATPNIAKTPVLTAYSLIGPWCFFLLDLAMTAGTGSALDVTISLPVPAVGMVAGNQFGNVMYFDISEAANVRRSHGAFELVAGLATVTLSVVNPQYSGLWGSAGATSVAAGDVIRGSGFYRWV